MLFTILGVVGSSFENQLRISDPAEENESMHSINVKLAHGPQINLGRGED